MLPRMYQKHVALDYIDASTYSSLLPMLCAEAAHGVKLFRGKHLGPWSLKDHMGLHRTLNLAAGSHQTGLPHQLQRLSICSFPSGDNSPFAHHVLASESIHALHSAPCSSTHRISHKNTAANLRLHPGRRKSPVPLLTGRSDWRP